MAFCSKCGKALSQGALFCSSCGSKIEPSAQNAASGKVIVNGVTQKALVGFTMKVYANGVFKGEVKKMQKLEFDIDCDSVITVSCANFFTDETIRVRAGRTSVIDFKYNRIIGQLEAALYRNEYAKGTLVHSVALLRIFCCVKEDNKYEILRVLRKGIK